MLYYTDVIQPGLIVARSIICEMLTTITSLLDREGEMWDVFCCFSV